MYDVNSSIMSILPLFVRYLLAVKFVNANQTRAVNSNSAAAAVFPSGVHNVYTWQPHLLLLLWSSYRYISFCSHQYLVYRCKSVVVCVILSYGSSDYSGTAVICSRALVSCSASVAARKPPAGVPEGALESLRGTTEGEKIAIYAQKYA